MKNKSKIISKAFTYDENQDSYTVRLKKFNKLWLLLLLLPLLFLFFLKIEKTIKVEIFSEKNESVADSKVTLNYNPEYIYKEGEFFVKEKYEKSLSTNSIGKVKFVNLEFTLYSLFFKALSEVNISASSTKCYQGETRNIHFYKILFVDTVSLKVLPRLVDIDFKVIDIEDKRVLPDATVVLNYSFEGIEKMDSLVADAMGIVRFNKVPSCMQIKNVAGKLDGYKNDTLLNNNVDQIRRHIDDRTLYLKPIKKKINFFVVDCKTGEPLPNAKATIRLLSDDEEQKTQIVSTTDIDGQGKGVFDDAHILLKINIEVEKKYYNNGNLPRSYRVRDFINLPDSLRTICLEPKENSITFLNIDSIKQEPLGGVTNKITINRGREVIEEEVLSNRNGVFNVAEVFATDTLSIKASKEPYFYDNSHSVRDHLVEDILETGIIHAIIPLKPKKTSLHFRIFEEYNRTLLQDVELKVKLDGVLQDTITRTNTGELTIEAYYNSTISIIASKTGYLDNEDIDNDEVKFLAESSQEQRDLYLKLPPCTMSGEKDDSGGNSVKEYDLKVRSGTFKFEYNTGPTHADIIKIYDCRKEEIDSSSPIFEFDGTTKGGAESVWLSFTDRIITVKVEGRGNTASIWSYTVNCPE